MFKLLENFFTNLFTKNRTRIPLFTTYFNYKKYKESGKENSCLSMIHPILANDEYVKHYLKVISDYVRETYNLEEL